MMRGQEIYLQKCAACHGTGLSGAPKFRDKEAWAPRITQGMDHLVQSAIEGKGNMPAQGGKTGLGDEKIRAAIGYMVENSK
jgi:cytochrome c5